MTEDAVGRALRSPTTASTGNPLLHGGNVDAACGLTPDAAAVLAVISSPTLAAARDQVRSADARALQAGLLPNPTLAFSVDMPFGAGSGGNVVGYGLTLDWEITAMLTLDANKQAAHAGAEQSRLDVAWQEWQIAEAARQAVYDVRALQQNLSITRDLADRLDDIARRFQTALSRGDVSALDASAIAAAAGEARVAAAAARRDLADAEATLRRSLGVAADADVTLDPQTPLPRHDAVPDAARLLERLPQHRIDLAALRRGYDSQEQALRAAILGQFPKIRIGVAQSRDTGDFLTAGPAVSIELPVFDRNQGNIGLATATREQLFDEYVARVYEAQSDVARGVTAVRRVDDQLSVMDGQVKTLQALFDAHETALQKGDIDVTAFYTTAVSLAQRQTDRLKLCQDLVHAHIALELAAGVRLPMGGTN